MKPHRILPVLFCLAGMAFPGYRDHTHYSSVFDTVRHFRVYAPSDYDSAGAKTYPVIYYFNGCRGSYQGDQYSSYLAGGGYAGPYHCNTLLDSTCDPVMNLPYNGDFAFFTDSHDVIIVMVDGKLYGPGGCDVYYPYGISETYHGNDFNFSRYLPELFGVVDSLYLTKAEPRYRAVTGLSMGGHAALWLSAAVPHLIQSASSFCHSCSFWPVDSLPNRTPVDVIQLWRNYRGLSMRTSGNRGDYLYRYSQQLGAVLGGAGFPHEYHETDFDRHWAADMDSQLIFHMQTFEQEKTDPPCFSYINPYPEFDIWGYSVTSAKAREGWIYLRDVTKNSLGVHTRYRFPFGRGLPPFNIQVTTAPNYTSNRRYQLVKYDYRADTFTVSSVTADKSGRLTVTSEGGMGEEFGINGAGLAAPLAVLADTSLECLFLRADGDSAFGLDLVNLSETDLSDIVISVSTQNSFLQVVSGQKSIASLPALSRVHMDSCFVLRGTYTEFHNIGYVKIALSAGGVKQDKESILQVHVTDEQRYLDSSEVMIMDGVADTGGRFSIWFAVNEDSIGVTGNFWSTVPIGGGRNPDVHFADYATYSTNRGRPVMSALVTLDRKPTLSNPVEIPLMAEITYPALNIISYNGVDEFSYRYRRLILPLELAIGAETRPGTARPRPAVSARPNPFNPRTEIRLCVPGHEGANLSFGLYALNGKKVREYGVSAFKKIGPGDYRLSWNGTDALGRPVSGGVYIGRLVCGGRAAHVRVVFLP